MTKLELQNIIFGHKLSISISTITNRIIDLKLGEKRGMNPEQVIEALIKADIIFKMPKCFPSYQRVSQYQEYIDGINKIRGTNHKYLHKK